MDNQLPQAQARIEQLERELEKAEAHIELLNRENDVLRHPYRYEDDEPFNWRDAFTPRRFVRSAIFPIVVVIVLAFIASRFAG